MGMLAFYMLDPFIRRYDGGQITCLSPPISIYDKIREQILRA
jgi:hypothetical protein